MLQKPWCCNGKVMLTDAKLMLVEPDGDWYQVALFFMFISGYVSAS